MTLFVVVTRNKRSGVEYIDASDEVEGYDEYSQARAHADHVRANSDAMFEVYVGRVTEVTEP